MEPIVSLIFPTTGERASVAVALRSALAQDFPGLEIVVVDDAVAGSTWTQTEPYATLLADPRVRVVPFNRRRGCTAAKNAGRLAARGQWLCYLDDDNECRPGRVRAQHELAVRTGAPVVLCGMEFRAGGRRRQKQITAAEFRGDARLLETLADTNALFIRRDAHPGWEEDLQAADDACLFQAVLQLHAVEVVPNVREVLVIYNSHQGPRINLHALPHYRGLRRLLVRWTRGYSRDARRVQLCRQLLAADKYTVGRWWRFARHARALLHCGGLREWRMIANAVGFKLPVIRRWMIS